MFDHDGTSAFIKWLVIPPAWTDVWISENADGHLRATGPDARGRKQYRYHPQWSRVRDETKYGRAIQFGESLGAIRKRVDADLASAGLTRERVLATIVRLPELTFIRVGNSEYARSNKSFGLTTWQDRHVQIAGAKVVFRFRGMPFVPMTSMNISGQLRKMNSPRRIFARGLERC